MTREEVLNEVNVIYERLSHPEDIENGCYSFTDGYYTEALEILIDYYEVGLIEELEKIQRKLISKLSEGFDFGIEAALNIIYEELSEMKGEQNG